MTPHENSRKYKVQKMTQQLASQNTHNIQESEFLKINKCKVKGSPMNTHDYGGFGTVPQS